MHFFKESDCRTVNIAVCNSEDAWFEPCRIVLYEARMYSLDDAWFKTF